MKNTLTPDQLLFLRNFVFASTILFGGLAAIWKTSSGLNLFIKMLMLAMTVAGIVGVLLFYVP